ncbi:MAG: chemotaxis protein CheX [Thermodesulfobacteriota bacterium]|nr:chemotaxis protein CheX [Thermodesulfobacteriota bacterium]
MAIKFFGQFLIDKKIITRLDLLRAIELQEKTNLRFGDLVIAIGLMTTEQISSTLRAQRHEDLQFGDMAVKLGFLSPAQVKQVLNRQKSEHLYIGEALVKLETITQKKLSFYLGEFKKTQKAPVTEKIIIPEGVPHQPVWEIVVDMTHKMLTRIAGVTFQTGSCTTIKKLPTRQVAVEIGFSGSISARYLLTISDNTRKLIAHAILKEEKAETGTANEVDNSVKEFVNIICSNVVSKATQLGYSIDTTSAQMRRLNNADLEIPEEQIGLLFPIYFSNGEIFELTICCPKDV